MGKDEQTLKDIEDLIFNDASHLVSETDIALHIMHRFNVDIDTVLSCPAFDDSLSNFFCLKKI